MTTPQSPVRPLKCRKCKAEYTVSDEEKAALIRIHDVYCAPKTCPDCRKKGQAFRVVINAQKAGLFKDRPLFIPVGSSEIRDEINAYREKLGLTDMRLFEDPQFEKQNRPLIRG